MPCFSQAEEFNISNDFIRVVDVTPVSKTVEVKSAAPEQQVRKKRVSVDHEFAIIKVWIQMWIATCYSWPLTLLWLTAEL